MHSEPGSSQPGSARGFSGQQGQPGGGPQAAFSPHVGGYHYGGSYPPPPPTGGSFFDSVRSSGFFRSEPRVLGGVCAGLAARFGWDRTLVRVLTVVLTLFAPILFAVYGLAWAFLPEHRDGRIHFQTLLQGRFDIAQLGALVMVLLGLGNIGPWFAVFGSTGIGVMLALTAIAVTVVAIVGASASSQAPYGRSFSSQAPFASPSHGMETPMHTTSQGGVPSPEPSDDWRTQGGPSTPPPSQGATFAPSSGPAGSQMPQHQAPPVSPTASSAGGPAPFNAPRASAQPVPPRVPPQGMANAMGPGMTPGRPQQGAYGQGASPFAAPHSPYQTPYQAPPQPGVPLGGATSPAGGPVPPPSFGPAPAYAGTQVRWAPPVPAMKPRVLPTWLNLATTGLIALVIAATLYILHDMTYSDATYNDFAQVLLIGGGACLVIVGMVIALASLRDRGAGWMVALSIIGALIAIPTIMIGVAGLNHHEDNSWQYYSAEQSPAYYHWTEGSQTQIVNGELDLSDMPTNLHPTIEIEDVTGELKLLVRKDQPVEVEIVDMLGTLKADYLTPGDEWVPTQLGFATDTTFRSVPAQDSPMPTVRIHNMLGTLRIVELDLEEDSFASQSVEAVEPASPSTQTPQSTSTPQSGDASQSADRPQSATTPATGQ